MRYLWLDDERDPAQHNCAGWEWIKDPGKLIATLQAESMANTFLSLDHDLGSGVMTGYDVIAWIEQQVLGGGREPPAGIRIHTQNPVGRQNMTAALNSIYGRTP